MSYSTFSHCDIYCANTTAFHMLDGKVLEGGR